MGAPRRDCSIVAARLAAAHHLLDRGFIDLPRRRMSARAEGFSGSDYEGWAELLPERAFIVGSRLADQATAELTLADGRKLLVDLTGTRSDGIDGGAVITVKLSDPAMAEMDIAAIRSHLRLLPTINWCSHWQDQRLAKDAGAASEGVAREALDAWTAEDEAEFRVHLPPDLPESQAKSLRRETLLHRHVKQILQDARRLNTPLLRVSVRKEAPEDYCHDWYDHRVELAWWAGSQELQLADVVLERGLGRIVPDVQARLAKPLPIVKGGVTTTVGTDFDQSEEDQLDDFPLTWPDTVLVEVAVTHRVDAAKLRRVQDLDLPTLELDLGSLGGRVTLEGLRRLVIEGLEGKRWLHHPALRMKRAQLRREIREHPEVLAYAAHRAARRRPSLLAAPAVDWAQRYVGAVIDFHNANAELEVLRRTTGPRFLEFLDEDSDEWAEIALAAEALAAHGFTGAIDNAMVRKMLPRVLSIKLNKGVGYAVNTAYQVINAIMNIRGDDTQWLSVYLIAAKAFNVERHFDGKQLARYRTWKHSVVQKIEDEDAAYLRPGTYDALLSALFPEMAPGLAHGKGRAGASTGR
jgi:hypothetical protein